MNTNIDPMIMEIVKVSFKIKTDNRLPNTDSVHSIIAVWLEDVCF